MRGFLVRQKFAERSRFLRTWLPAVIKIQVAGTGLGSPGPGVWALWFPSCLLSAEWEGGDLPAPERWGLRGACVPEPGFGSHLRHLVTT